jgi:hypothetical protein
MNFWSSRKDVAILMFLVQSNLNLHGWVKTQCSLFSSGKLLEERAAKLNVAGFVWSTKSTQSTTYSEFENCFA